MGINNEENDWVKELEFNVPMQDEEHIAEANAMMAELYGEKFTPLRTTEDHLHELVNQFIDAFMQVEEAGGAFVGDGIKVSIKIEYDPEDK